MADPQKLDRVIAFAQAGGRVYPNPSAWHTLWELLPGRHRVGLGWQPPLPLILAAWDHTSNAEKRDRFLLHLRYASEHGVLDRLQNGIRIVDKPRPSARLRT